MEMFDVCNEIYGIELNLVLLKQYELLIGAICYDNPESYEIYFVVDI